MMALQEHQTEVVAPGQCHCPHAMQHGMFLTWIGISLLRNGRMRCLTFSS